MSRNKTVIILVITVVLIFGLPLAALLGRTNKAKVEIIVGPSTAKVKVDGKEAPGSPLYVSKGKHTFTATLSGFSSDSKTIDVKNNTSVKLLLNPQTDEAQQLLQDNPKLQLDRERIGSSGFGETSAQLEKKYPFLARLPLSGQRFSVSYGTAQQTKKSANSVALALYINATDASERRNALARLVKELNVDPSSIEIVFENYTNPFLREAPAQ